MHKILIIGYFGYITNQLDGQTVKTRNLYNLLIKNSIDCDVFDTQRFQYSKKSIFILLKKIINSKSIYYLPAQKNLKLIFPLLFMIVKILNKRLYYFVVGGWLTEFLEDKLIHQILLGKIDKVLPETQSLLDQLSEKYKFKNMILFPNFRFTHDVFSSVKRKGSSVFKMVFMSRIIKEKGLEVLEELFLYIKDANDESQFSIDFYGPIAEKDMLYFQEMISCYDFIYYKGVLEPDVIIDRLSMYDVLLLPTRYYTEGLPGAIVDAYMSGIPVIVTKWKHADEFVKDRKTGIVIPFDNPVKSLIQEVYFLKNNPSILKEMKEEARLESSRYSEKSALSILKNNNL